MVLVAVGAFLLYGVLAYAEDIANQNGTATSRSQGNSPPVHGAGVPAPDTRAKPDAATQAWVHVDYGKLPLSFEANRGQTDAQVKFLSRGSGYTLFLTSTQAVLVLHKSQGRSSIVCSRAAAGRERTTKINTAVLHIQLVGANTAPLVTGLEELPGKSHYFVGNDPTRWQTNIPHYSKVRYEAVYPGIDLVYYGHQRQLEYDFVVAPRANPKAIQLAFQGADKLRLDAAGNLILHTAGGEAVQHAPRVYQEVDGIKQDIPARYVLVGGIRSAFRWLTMIELSP
jgi:hypothetical protein